MSIQCVALFGNQDRPASRPLSRHNQNNPYLQDERSAPRSGADPSTWKVASMHLTWVARYPPKAGTRGQYVAPRTRAAEARAAAACLLLDLSHDEVSIVTHELCDPLQPLLAVHLSARPVGFGTRWRSCQQRSDTHFPVLYALYAISSLDTEDP